MTEEMTDNNDRENDRRNDKATSMAPQQQSATAHSRRHASLLLWLPSCNPQRPILGGILRYFYSSPAAIRDDPFSEASFATSMAPQLQSATAHSRRHPSLLLWLPSRNPQQPILGGMLRYFYGPPAAIR